MKELTINVQEINEDGEKYFIATCEEYKGFLTEGQTLDEIRANVEDNLPDFVNVVETRKQQKQIRDVLKLLQYTLIFNSPKNRLAYA